MSGHYYDVTTQEQNTNETRKKTVFKDVTIAKTYAKASYSCAMNLSQVRLWILETADLEGCTSIQGYQITEDSPINPRS